VKPIFISYSSQRRDLTEALARRLEGVLVTLADGTTEQLAVWWDRDLHPGRPFSPDITRALDDAPAVIVIWTEGAVSSQWVYGEAVRAADQRKIVTVRDKSLDPKRIPLPFNIVHTCTVDDHPAILNAVRKIIAGERSELPANLPGAGFRNWLLDPKQEALPARAVMLRPASLLVARHRIVPFIDIHDIRKNFVAWATGAPADPLGRVALGRLVHGPGGLGKTRAMIEVADLLTREHGWLAGFVPRGVRGAAPGDDPFDRLILGGHDAAGLLLVVDYTESRQDDVVWLADRLVAHADRASRPARLVLLSRGAGEWWRELVRKSQSLQDLVSLGGDRYDEIEIPERIAPADRLSMFNAAVESFGILGSQLNADGARGRSPPKSSAFARAIESGNDYDRPLALQMAALLHAYGVEAGPGGHSVAHLLDRILGLEYDHWDKTLNFGHRANLREAIKRGVAQLTLVDGVSTRAAGAALIGADPFYRAATDINVPNARRDLELLFPGASDGLAALEPDLIGEHHVAEVADAALVDVCLAWADDHKDKRRQILTALQRATQPEHGPMADRAVPLLDHLIRSRAKALAPDMVAVMVDTPGALLSRFEQHLDALDDEALEVVYGALPPQSLALMEFALQVAMRLADSAREISAGATAASDVSRHSLEALLSLLCHKLQRAWRGNQRDPVGLSRLAGRLNDLGIRLSDLGHREEALAASQEAVDIRRRLAQTRPDAFLPDLASSLNNLGKDLSDLGRREEALAATQEAVDIYRRHAETRPDAFLPDLAMSLNNLGIRLSDLGRREAALAASQQAVDIRRRLAQTRPDAFLPDLAVSLSNLGIRLSDLGRREEALAASQEAIDIYRRLAETLCRKYETLRQEYIAACEKTGTAPDTALLERVARALGGGANSDEAAVEH
jgi:tetratricopeptide (TPR) repeat protein